MDSNRILLKSLNRYPHYAPRFKLSEYVPVLVVVDMQYCCADRASLTGNFLREHHPNLYETYFAAIDVIIPKIERLISYFHASERQVVYLTVSAHLASGIDFEPQRRHRETVFESELGKRSVLTQRDQPAAQILQNLRPTAVDLVINKVSQSAFSSTGLDQLLRNMGVQALAFCGVVTNGCVMANAIDASDRGYRTVVVEDACAALDRTLHDTALFHLGHLYGRLLSTEQVIQELESASAEPSEQVRP